MRKILEMALIALVLVGGARANDLQVLGSGLGQARGTAAAAHQWMQATRGGAEAVRGIDRAGDAVRGARMLRRARQADRIKDLVVVGRNTARVVPAGLRAVRGARALRKVRVGAALVLGGLTGGGALVAFVGTEIAFELALRLVEEGLAWVIEEPGTEEVVPAEDPVAPDAPRIEPGSGGMFGQGDPMPSGPARRSKPNKLQPDPNAEGPHTTFKRDPATGEITGWQDWVPSDPRNPNPWTPGSRYRGRGKPHGGVHPPLIVEPNGRARTADTSEIPPRK